MAPLLVWGPGWPHGQYTLLVTGPADKAQIWVLWSDFLCVEGLSTGICLKSQPYHHSGRRGRLSSIPKTRKLMQRSSVMLWRPPDWELAQDALIPKSMLKFLGHSGLCKDRHMGGLSFWHASLMTLCLSCLHLNSQHSIRQVSRNKSWMNS